MLGYYQSAALATIAEMNRLVVVISMSVLAGEMHCKTLDYDSMFNFVSVGLGLLK